MTDASDDPPPYEAPQERPPTESIDSAFEAELAAANRRADESWDRYLRAEADLDNFKRVAQRRQEEATRRTRERLLLDFLEVTDNLERALAHRSEADEAFGVGVEATYREMARFLEREGVRALDALAGPFDPAVHEAVSVIEVPDVDRETVMAVERTGYTLDGELLRPARVVVGRPRAVGGG